MSDDETLPPKQVPDYPVVIQLHDPRKRGGADIEDAVTRLRNLFPFSAAAHHMRVARGELPRPEAVEHPCVPMLYLPALSDAPRLVRTANAFRSAAMPFIPLVVTPAATPDMVGAFATATKIRISDILVLDRANPKDFEVYAKPTPPSDDAPLPVITVGPITVLPPTHGQPAIAQRKNAGIALLPMEYRILEILALNMDRGVPKTAMTAVLGTTAQSLGVNKGILIRKLETLYANTRRYIFSPRGMGMHVLCSHIQDNAFLARPNWRVHGTDISGKRLVLR